MARLAIMRNLQLKGEKLSDDGGADAETDDDRDDNCSRPALENASTAYVPPHRRVATAKSPQWEV